MQDLVPDRPLSRQEQVWLQRFNELADRYKDGYVPIGASNTLGFWVRSQRKRKQLGSLHDWQEQMLVKIGFKWSDNLNQEREKKWRENYAKSVEILRSTNSPNDWTKKQLYKLSKGQLQPWQIDLINELDLNHEDHIQLRDKLWETNFEEVRQFKTKHKQLPHSKFPGAEKLGTWLESQRRMARKGSLSESRLTRLRSIGFTFERVGQKDRVAKWMVYYNQLKDFYTQNGVVPVPRNEQLIQLSRWTDRQRRDKKGLLAKQIKLLDAIDYPWDTGHKEENQKVMVVEIPRTPEFQSGKWTYQSPLKEQGSSQAWPMGGSSKTKRVQTRGLEETQT